MQQPADVGSMTVPDARRIAQSTLRLQGRLRIEFEVPVDMRNMPPVDLLRSTVNHNETPMKIVSYRDVMDDSGSHRFLVAEEIFGRRFRVRRAIAAREKQQ